MPAQTAAPPVTTAKPAQPAPTRAWSGSGQLRGTPAGIRFFIFVIRLLGVRFAYACGVVPAAYFTFASPDIPATMDFHRRVFGKMPWWKRRWCVFKHFHSFGQMIIDRFAILSGKVKSFTFGFDGEQHVYDALAKGRGVVLMSAHLGNWEAGGQLLNRVQTTINVAGIDREVSAIRGMLTEGSRARFNYIVLDGSPTDTIPILAALRRGEVVAMLADRAYGTPVARVPFLGDPAPFPVGPYLVAALAEAPLVHVFGVRQPGGHYQFYGFPAEYLQAPARSERAAFLEKCAAHYAERLEKLVRQYPYQWFNFYPFWKAPPRP